jgi:hypothetical protein
MDSYDYCLQRNFREIINRCKTNSYIFFYNPSVITDVQVIGNRVKILRNSIVILILYFDD